MYLWIVLLGMLEALRSIRGIDMIPWTLSRCLTLSPGAFPQMLRVALTVMVRELMLACLVNLVVLEGMAQLPLPLLLRLLLPLLIPFSLVLIGTLVVR